MRKRLIISLLVVLPAVIGIILWLAYWLGWLPDYVVYLRVSLSWMVLVIGLVLTAFCVIGWAFSIKNTQRFQKKIKDTRAEAVDQHRHFLRRLDHELKNPLTAIQIEVANLDAELGALVETFAGGSAPKNSQALPRLKEQLTRLNELVVQLRKLGELESRLIELEPVRIDELLIDLVDEFQNSAYGAEREITLNLPEIPWPLPEITGDADLVYLALRNLLGNAVKFTQPGDAIQVRAYDDSMYVIVEIADTGPGIPEDELPYVWDELYRGKLARGLPGSGLGLAIVKAITERHQGQVLLRSRVDKGTVITVRLPIDR
jgi:two-component system OmpR family sensor kinase